MTKKKAAADPTSCPKCGSKLNRIGECVSVFGPCNAEGRAPSCVSDTTRFPGHLQGGGQFSNPVTRRNYLAKARKAGVNPNGKIYYSSLAAFPGDPAAWQDSKAGQEKLLTARGWESEGDVKVKGRDAAPPKPIRLAEDIVMARVEEELERRYPDAVDVKIKRQEYEDIREAVIEKHGAPPAHKAAAVKLSKGRDPRKPAGKKVAHKK